MIEETLFAVPHLGMLFMWVDLGHLTNNIHFPSPNKAGTYHAVPVQTGKQYHYQDILLCIKQNNVQGQPGLEILCFFPLESLAPVLSSVLLKTDAA